MVTVFLGIAEDGSCRGYASRDGLTNLRKRADQSLRETGVRLAIVEVDVPLPIQAGEAAVTTSGQPSGDRSTSDAKAWLALCAKDGSCQGAAFDENDLGRVREAAREYETRTGQQVPVVRLDVPLPAGSGSARVVTL